MKLTSFFNDDEDILLLNETYLPPQKDDSTGKWSNAILYLTYKDLKTNEKKLRTIHNPKTDIFITKPEYRNSFNTQRLYLSPEQVDKYTVPYTGIARQIMKIMAEDGTDMDHYKLCQNTPKEAHKWRHAYFSDYNICDYALTAHRLNNPETPDFELSTAFLDIESDIYGLSSSEMDDAQGKINAISIVFTHNKFGVKCKHPQVLTLLLRNHSRYRQQEYFENHMDKFLAECHDEFDKRYNSPVITVRVYDDEIKLIGTALKMINTMSPDFTMIWNMGYDIPTIIRRLQKLGENPMDYFCHPDFEESYYRYNFDHIYRSDFKNKNESFDCTSYVQYVDQMLMYAGIRKAQPDMGGFSLDNIAKKELKAEKRKYDKKGVTVLNGAIEEYWNFVKYSINDVLLQLGIHNETNDIVTIFDQAYDSGTRTSKTLKQSVNLTNDFRKNYFEMNIIPRNNINVDYARHNTEEQATDDELATLMRFNAGEEEDTDYDDFALPGAIVGDPKLNAAEGVKIFGRKSRYMFKLVGDLDFLSMYPYIYITCNIGPHTQWGRIIIEKMIVPNENPDNSSSFIRGGKFMEDYTTKDSIKLGAWFMLKDAMYYIVEYNKKNHSDSVQKVI